MEFNFQTTDSSGNVIIIWFADYFLELLHKWVCTSRMLAYWHGCLPFNVRKIYFFIY